MRDRRYRGEGNDYRWLRIGEEAEERGKQGIMGSHHWRRQDWQGIRGYEKEKKNLKKECIPYTRPPKDSPVIQFTKLL